MTDPAPCLVTDILGDPWVSRRLPLTQSPAAPEADHAVLVHQRGAVPAGHGPRHRRAVLYLHGRNDYFFQTWLADAFLAAGYEFYALDLRACGRAGLGHPSPHDVRDLRVHDEEIATSLEIIRHEHGHDVVVLNAHSTGGLQAAIWAKDHPGSVEALTLNSPWLDLNSSAIMRSYGSAWVDLVARRDPERIIDNPSEAKAVKAAEAAEAAARATIQPHSTSDTDPVRHALGGTSAVGADPGPVGLDLYARSLHARWGGPWDWDLTLKPSPAFPVRAGFLAGVRRLQREVHHGLGIEVPVLVCCSTRSCSHDASPEEARHSDVVLSVRQIVERSAFLGSDVTVVQVPGGVHDLALSLSPAREEYLAVLTGWLQARLP
ncbi:alpha/beta hydrolase [Actinomyces howellii]|uniref:alpha/beta hydrolase n=1 Tax=Actinomyces howellii TaxID=52771 RepID=UPI001E3681A6|nr:alpha/beta fold hydrolase [Actinomyces howellii]